MPRRPLDLCVLVPAALCVVALPVGFVVRDAAIVAAIYGLYYALPALLVWSALRLRRWLPRWLQLLVVLAVVLGAPVMLLFSIWLWHAAPLAWLSLGAACVSAWRLARRPPAADSR